ncbi:flavodoxin [Stenotrophomonas sp. 24(2023)]|uniref:flavodoxin n=1 Tax=Stenotrophomonas sp. 24(2023) TaxID=3068324 RepID=UPI0027DEDBBF|nr:flavodoxin [Stenotrophomonas sp. 24(2023)]WMJ69467.1 flavodoxin [Stenotrophomonas sp. 24(2023)]
MQILIVVASLSGNTRELARQVAARCRAAGHIVHWQEADDLRQPPPLPLDQADLVLLGSWTDNAGRTPSEMKAWVATATAHGQQPGQVAVFGTGETQWGAEYYCGAVHRLRRFFHSDYPPLEIEQMPHGPRHAEAIIAWTDAVLAHYRSTTHADHRRHHA